MPVLKSLAQLERSGRSIDASSFSSGVNRNPQDVIPALSDLDNIYGRPNLSNNATIEVSGKLDHRARISAKPGATQQIYGNGIMKPLYTTGGLLFPYTPTLSDTTSVNYDAYEPVHSNQGFSAFKSRASKEITAIGTFTTMNQDEARVNIANLHFLRTVTQMYFGQNDPNRGTPPPVLLFNAYGEAIYRNVPVIITNYTFEMPADVDYVQCTTSIVPGESADESDGSISSDGSATSWVPTRFSISVQMTVQNTPGRLRKQFNLNEFREGSLIKNGGWV